MTKPRTVFISSTSIDLEPYRAAAAAAAEASGFAVSRVESWSPNGQRSLPACLKKVADTSVVVVIVAHRYGWVPDDPSNTGAKSVTWLECEHAWAAKIPVLTFLVDPEYEWAPELYENYRLVKERNLPRAEYIALLDEVERNEKKLLEFKAELSRDLRKHFTDAAGFRGLVSEALMNWRLENEPMGRRRPATRQLTWKSWRTTTARSALPV